ncbi:Calreticulin family-domain-containing protein [Pelagophyceae sp. CCMP2097]|nr:Calreticulin family-domain-containing protein [Pelagophyceae sp. CCMP2097]
MQLETANQHYGVAAPVDFQSAGDLVFQYEVTLSDGLACGGAYVKLLEATPSLDVASFDDQTPFVIMFGPDKCGSTDKVHFILRHRNPVSSEWSEHHLAKAVRPVTDKKVHLYTLIIKQDDSLEILVDGESQFAGTLNDALEPPLTPAAEIDDAADSKPEDWVDEPKMDDPEAAKPEDWDEDAPRKVDDASAVKPAGWLDDEPALVPDPEAVMPSDWDAEEDGAWEAPDVDNPKCAKGPGCGEWQRPVIDNPLYKGKWVRPKVDHPGYKGLWAPRKVANPNFFEAKETAKSLPAIGAVAVEVWTTNLGITFDNFALGADVEAAKEFAKAFYEKKEVETLEEEKKAAEKRAKKAEKKKAESGAFKTAVVEAYERAFALAVMQPAAAAGTAGVVLLTLLYLIFGGSKKVAPAAAAAEAAPAADGPEEEKKKTPRAD